MEWAEIVFKDIWKTVLEEIRTAISMEVAKQLNEIAFDTNQSASEYSDQYT